MAVSIPLSPESFPPSCATSISFTPSLSLSPFFFLPLSPLLLFLFHSACTSSSYFLFLPPSLSFSLSHTPSRFCIRVPIAVESLSGLAERRFRRHDNEPRKPSHSLTPFLPSSLSLPLSTSPRLHRFSPPPKPRVSTTTISGRLPSSYVSTCYAYPCIRVFACLSLTYCTHAYHLASRMQERRLCCEC